MIVWPKVAWGGLELPDLKTPLLPQRWNSKLVCPGTFTVVSMGFGHLALKAMILWLNSLAQRLVNIGALIR